MDTTTNFEKQLTAMGLYKPSETDDIVSEALSSYTGDIHRVKQNIHDAISIIKEVD